MDGLNLLVVKGDFGEHVSIKTKFKGLSNYLALYHFVVQLSVQQ